MYFLCKAILRKHHLHVLALEKGCQAEDIPHIIVNFDWLSKSFLTRRDSNRRATPPLRGGEFQI